MNLELPLILNHFYYGYQSIGYIRHNARTPFKYSNGSSFVKECCLSDFKKNIAFMIRQCHVIVHYTVEINGMGLPDMSM